MGCPKKHNATQQQLLMKQYWCRSDEFFYGQSGRTCKPFGLMFWDKQPEVPWDFQAGVFSDIWKWDMAEQVVPSKSKKWIFEWISRSPQDEQAGVCFDSESLSALWLCCCPQSLLNIKTEEKLQFLTKKTMDPPTPFKMHWFLAAALTHALTFLLILHLQMKSRHFSHVASWYSYPSIYFRHMASWLDFTG